MIFKQCAGKKLFILPDPDLTFQVIEPGFPSAAGGWWDDYGNIGCCVGAWQAKAAPSYAASLVDLSLNGNNLIQTAGIVPWNAPNGWQFVEALAQLLDTTLLPASGWSMLCRYANYSSTASASVMGQWTGNARFFVQPDDNAGNRAYGSGGFVAIAGIAATGNMGIAGQQGYLNGVPDGAPIPGWGPVAQSDVVIGGLRLTGLPNRYATVNVYAASMYDCTNTAPQMAAVEAWMAAI